MEVPEVAGACVRARNAPQNKCKNYGLSWAPAPTKDDAQTFHYIQITPLLKVLGVSDPFSKGSDKKQ
jgi:hypothetical protein